MPHDLTLVGHRLCPYVQRVVIVMHELELDYDREDIDLENKPRWLKDISPEGRVPVLQVAQKDWLFESNAIVDFLNTYSGGDFLPHDPIEKAKEMAWVHYVDDMLALIAKIIYRDQDAYEMICSVEQILGKLQVLEKRRPLQPYFSGREFGLLDSVLVTLFRYFPVIEKIPEVYVLKYLSASSKTWWEVVERRHSVIKAVPQTFTDELSAFIAEKQSYMGRSLMAL